MEAAVINKQIAPVAPVAPVAKGKHRKPKQILLSNVTAPPPNKMVIQAVNPIVSVEKPSTDNGFIKQVATIPVITSAINCATEVYGKAKVKLKDIVIVN